MKTILIAALALCLAVSPAFAYQFYNFEYDRGHTVFRGPDGDFVIYPLRGGSDCGRDSYDDFVLTLAESENSTVKLQTYLCGSNLQVCIDPNLTDGNFIPLSCGTFSWRHTN